jgi:hypothetical protein
MSKDWHHYAIYYNPKDYPGKYVVRRWAIQEGNPEPVPDKDPMAVVDGLSEARKAVPAGLVRIQPHPEDDPVIVESWI